MTDQQALSVLYVEDYALGIALMRDALARRAPHIRLDVASTVAHAIDKLHPAQDSAYDVVLTDLDLPDGSGLDILEHIRSRNLRVAVVILSGSNPEETVSGAKLAAADGYLTKRGDYVAQVPTVLHAALARFRSRTGSAPGQSAWAEDPAPPKPK